MAISGVADGAQQTQLPQVTQSKNNLLGEDAFLKLLVTQLQNQNPLEPMKDTEFISQMTQFSILEGITAMKEELEGLADDLTGEFQQLTDAMDSADSGEAGASLTPGLQCLSLIGKTVKVDSGGEVVEGVVKSIKNFATSPTLVVEGQEFQLSDLLEVRI